MSWLVVNADDGGFADGKDDAILRCVRAGLVKSVSVIANGATTAAFVARARDEGLDLGVHLNLTEGRPLAGPLRGLTDAPGTFPGKAEAWRRAAAGAVNAADVRREVLAQWERLAALGVSPTHVDGHNHVHLFPAVREVLAELAPDLWVRVPCDPVLPEDLPPAFPEWARELAGPWKRTDCFVGYGFAHDPTADGFLQCMRGLGRVTEFMVHPGAREGSPFSCSPRRDRETEVLCSASLKREIERRDFVLASFAEVDRCA
ncbi:MAG: carbohydrate deacetylase [Planctomycetota bacterium]